LTIVLLWLFYEVCKIKAWWFTNRLLNICCFQVIHWLIFIWVISRCSFCHFLYLWVLNLGYWISFDHFRFWWLLFSFLIYSISIPFKILLYLSNLIINISNFLLSDSLITRNMIHTIICVEIIQLRIVDWQGVFLK